MHCKTHGYGETNSFMEAMQYQYVWFIFATKQSVKVTTAEDKKNRLYQNDIDI